MHYSVAKKTSKNVCYGHHGYNREAINKFSILIMPKQTITQCMLHDNLLIWPKTLPIIVCFFDSILFLEMDAIANNLLNEK